ncbi:MAG TPA: accessory factor UbiK family protein [Rhodocyclaceae bacterium]
MLNPKILEEMAANVGRILSTGPAADIERNARAVLGGIFSRLDLVTREEFDVQRELLARARDQVTRLEARIAELEARSGK